MSVLFQGFTPPPQYRPSASSRLEPARPAALCLPDPCGLGSDSHGGKVFSGKLLKFLIQTGSQFVHDHVNGLADASLFLDKHAGLASAPCLEGAGCPPSLATKPRRSMGRSASSSVAIPALCRGTQQVPAAGKAPLALSQPISLYNLGNIDLHFRSGLTRNANRSSKSLFKVYEITTFSGIRLYI